MLLNLNENIYGYVPQELLPAPVSIAPGLTECYLGVKEGSTDRYFLLTTTDKDDASAIMERLDRAEGKWYAAPHMLITGGELRIVAIQLPEKAVTIKEVLKSGPMPWNVALPLVYDIMASRMSQLGEDGYYLASLAPEHIFIVPEGNDYYPFAPYIPAWDVQAPNEVLLYTAPELLDPREDAAPGFKSWIYSAAMLLTMMIQRDYPRKLSVDPATASREEFIEDYLKVVETFAEIDALGELKNLLYINVNYVPRRRALSLEHFTGALLRIIKEKGMRVPEAIKPEVEEKAGKEGPPPIFTRPKDNPFDGDDAEDEFAASSRDRDRDREPRLKINFTRGKGGGFKDVAGMDDIKAKMTRNFISIVKNPDLARTFRIEPPNGLLLWGPPGNGKSFISQKLAEETGLLYATVNPGDLGSIFIHGTQGLIADLFTKCERMAKKEKSGVLLVLEEFDSLVPSRAAGSDTSNRNDEVAEFLTRLNNCASKGVYVIATTNRIDAIDPAIMRKGRMDEIIYVDLPDEKVRHELFRLELNDRPHEELDINRLVKLTDGFSSGDISYLVKESARKAFELTVTGADKKIVAITQEALENTISKAHPSVTATERRKYEKLRDSYERHRNELPRAGF